MTKMIKVVVPIIAILLLCGCENVTYDNYNTYNNSSSVTSSHNGKCLEYETQYKLDCGLFVDPDSFCKERKYEVCVRWEDEQSK